MSHFQESHYHSYNVFQELLLAESLAQGGVSSSSMMYAAVEPSPSLLTALIVVLVYTTVSTLRMLEWSAEVWPACSKCDCTSGFTTPKHWGISNA